MDVNEIDTEATDNWMVRMLRSRAFNRVPSANLQRIFISMEALPVRSGEVLFRQGDPGNHYYIIQSGRCAMSRVPLRGNPVKIGELGAGESFGEEALILNKPHEVTVTALTDAQLMRLKKQDFLDLILKPLLRSVNRQEAESMIAEGARWLDVRTAHAYEQFALPKSLNLELCMLRNFANKLPTNLRYIVCSDSIAESALGAFILGDKGFDVCYMTLEVSTYLAKTGNESPATMLEFNSTPLEMSIPAPPLREVAPPPTPQPPTMPPASSPKANDLSSLQAQLAAPNELIQALEQKIHDELSQQFEHRRLEMERQFEERLNAYQLAVEKELEKKIRTLNKN